MNNLTVIKPKTGIASLSFKPVLQYKELLLTLLLRDLKIRYRQTIIGSLWAILQPFLTMVVFSFFFGKIAQIPSEGIPYPLFSYAGLLLWTYFANSVNNASNSLISEHVLISKVYFPRMILPMYATLVGIFDYLIAGSIIVGFAIYYHFSLTWLILFLPLVVFSTWLLATGIGFWLAAFNVKYRDVRYALPFFIQLWIFATPVIYPASVAGNYKWIVMLNPMSGLIETHRALILGHAPINWSMLGISLFLTLIIFISGLYYFKSVERYFADVI